MLLLASVASILPCLCFLRFCHSISKGSEMSSLSSLLLLQLLALAVAVLGQKSPKFSRDDFPSDFVFGAGTSAYQVEGAAAEDGRTPSLWDAFTHEGKMPGNSTGDVAADGYHKHKATISLFLISLLINLLL
uniref:Uncharacterized protein n=1 Tax=Nelumbo nucifera TaxID=4432 RepID=A0A822YPM4_NELNU|nr:TPA_asm: hypothetical protein HUJ06_012140 [Nelumbo nucifera]